MNGGGDYYDDIPLRLSSGIANYGLLWTQTSPCFQLLTSVGVHGAAMLM